MKTPNFIKVLESKGVIFKSSEEFNTNNAWGFGGGYGTTHESTNGFIVRIGIACYRHAPSTTFVSIRKKGEAGFIWDDFNPPIGNTLKAIAEKMMQVASPEPEREL